MIRKSQIATPPPTHTRNHLSSFPIFESVFAALIVQVEIVECQPLPDGRFGIEIEGKQRFKIAECWEQDGYRVARPVFYSDTPVPEGTPEAEALGALAAEVEDLADRFVAKVREILSASRQPGTNRRALQQLLCRAGSKPAGPPETDMYQALSFWAGALSIHNDADRQDMIRMRDTKLRLQLVKGHLAVRYMPIHLIAVMTARHTSANLM